MHALLAIFQAPPHHALVWSNRQARSTASIQQSTFPDQTRHSLRGVFIALWSALVRATAV